MKAMRKGLWGLCLALALPLGARASDTQQPIAATEGGSRVVALSAGRYHSCGLKSDGAVECWGDNGDDQGGTHAGPYLSVSAGGFHSCGLKSDGAVECWGDNDFGQSDTPAGRYVAVSAALYHSCGLKSDGAVECWGRNVYGQGGTHAGPYVAVSAGAVHSCGLEADGAVECWGYNVNDLVGTHAGPYVAVSAGGFHSCGLKSDGAVECWGDNSIGQAGTHAGPYLSVSAGQDHSCGMKSDGTVECWGSNDFGQAGTHAGPYVSVSAGDYHSCGLKADGGVQCWGSGGPGSSDYPNYGQSTVPAELQATGAMAFGQIAAGNAHACQVRRDGTLSCWGNNTNGQANTPTGAFAQVVAGDEHSCAIGTDGKATCWGRYGVTNTAALASGLWRQLAAGMNGAVCALTADRNGGTCVRDTVVTTFDGYVFRHITRDYDNSSLSYQDPNTGNWVSVQLPGACGALVGYLGSLSAPPGAFLCPSHYSTGGFGYYNDYFTYQRVEKGLAHDCGLLLDGRLICHGSNSDHQLDNLPAVTDKFRALSLGWNHACAIRDNGQLACWGNNVNGQATPPAGSDTYVQVAAGNTFTCAIRSDGVRVCWGSDNQGQAPQLTLSPANLPNGRPGVAYGNQSFGLIDSAGPYVSVTPAFAVTDGALPPGLSLSAAGVLSGTPTTAGSYTFSMEGEDANGFAATRSYIITIDGTPPAIDYTLTSLSPGSNGWYRGDASVTWSVVDPQSAVTRIGCVDSTLSGDTGAAGVSYSCSATSAGGTTGPVSVTLKRDATAPTIGIAPSPAANANGWHKANVAILASCSDPTPGSGIASCPSVASVTSEGSTVVPSQTVQDNAGNSGSSNTLTIQLDKTAPAIVAAATTPPNANGWYSGNVVVHYTCSDALSGLAGACPADQTLTASGTSTPRTLLDNAGNSATSNTVTVKIDKSKPVVGYVLDPTAADGNNGWYRTTVLVDWTTADAQSGISTDCSDLTVDSDGSASYSCTATNGAGLSTTVTTVAIKRDATAPTLAPTTPSPLLRGKPYAANPHAGDATSGVASSGCGALDTGTLGTKSTTCTATDKAGNTNTVTLAYTVTTTCVNDGYSATQLTWCKNICEMGLGGSARDIWIRRWVDRYHDTPYCLAPPPPPLQ